MSEDRIEIRPYDPAWPRDYARERDAIAGLLGDRIEAVVHVGSTAVPGLAAKPTIDLLVGASRPGVDAGIVCALSSLGYAHLGEHGIAGREFFRKGLPPTHHVHWVPKGRTFWRSLILLRDYLRRHPDSAAPYEALKRALAASCANDREAYTRSKAALIGDLLRRARVWQRGRPWIFLDLEATCWETGTEVSRQEVIEIGAVRLDPGSFEERSRFCALVRPAREPALSPFCRRLTGIRQEDVDSARDFGAVLKDFVGWIGPPPARIFSWGEYDYFQLAVECRRRGEELPPCFEGHLDMRALFAESRRAAPQTMLEAMASAGVASEGAAHRGLEDALNLGRLARRVLREMEL